MAGYQSGGLVPHNHSSPTDGGVISAPSSTDNSQPTSNPLTTANFVMQMALLTGV